MPVCTILVFHFPLISYLCNGMDIILIIIVSLWLLGQLMRWWFKWWLKRRLTPREQPRQRRPEGEVRIEQTVRTEKKVNRNVGDYVEFEEEITENCDKE